MKNDLQQQFEIKEEEKRDLSPVWTTHNDRITKSIGWDQVRIEFNKSHASLSSSNRIEIPSADHHE